MEVKAENHRKIKIFEDENVVVIFMKGESDFLFVTFGDSVSLASGLNIYAESVAKKLKYSLLGFMAKDRNWYPNKSLEDSIHKCRHIIDSFNTRIIYGGSMGGYAAIKYSKLLKANQVITCCPQWSIDPEECEGKRNGYEKYFKPEMKGMGVKADDLAGDIYVIHDPRHQVDSFHYSRFKKLRKGIMAVHAPFVRHHATSVIAGSKNISAMVNAVQMRDPSLMRRIVCQIRRKSIVRQDNLLRASSVKHPILTAKIINNLNLRTEGAIDALQNIFNTLLEKERVEDLINVIGFLKASSYKHEFYSDLYEELKLKLLRNKIVTHHGYHLCYDPLSLSIKGDCGIGDKSKSVISLDIFVDIVDGEKVCSVSINGKLYLLYADECSVVVASDDDSIDKAKLIKIHEFNDGKHYLTQGGMYFSATQSGNVRLNRHEINEWETFHLA